MWKNFQARDAYLTLCVVAAMCTVVMAQQAGVRMTGAMQMDKHQTAEQTHGMYKMEHKPMQMEMAHQGIFEGTGEIIALLPDKGQLVIKHQEIAGFMAAMTMGYAVESTALLKGLKPGDLVNFKIDAAKKKIIGIKTRP